VGAHTISQGFFLIVVQRPRPTYRRPPRHLSPVSCQTCPFRILAARPQSKIKKSNAATSCSLLSISNEFFLSAASTAPPCPPPPASQPVSFDSESPRLRAWIPPVRPPIELPGENNVEPNRHCSHCSDCYSFSQTPSAPLHRLHHRDQRRYQDPTLRQHGKHGFHRVRTEHTKPEGPSV
jgi:hypothetical protein